MDEEETSALAWPGASRAIRRNATLLRAVGLVVMVCLAIVLSTLGIYLRSWRLQFEINQLKDHVLISNQPDSACEGGMNDEWSYGPIEDWWDCDARQREDFTRSDKEIYDQCVANHNYAQERFCDRGREVQIFVFNVTNPHDVVDGLTPRIVEVGRKNHGGPFVFFKDCKTFDTEFGPKTVEYSEYCYYTYKFAATEGPDLSQEVITVNVGLLEAIGNSINNMDYIIPVVWGTLALDRMNATTTTAEDYIRGQLLSFAWPNNFGLHFLSEFSQKPHLAGFRARDNAMNLYQMVLEPQRQSCTVNGTQYDRNQCISMANTLAIYARRYYENFQTYNVDPYRLRYQQGAGLFVRAKIGDLLGYYPGYDDPLSAYQFPKKVSWNVVRSQTGVQVGADIAAGRADSHSGVLNPGPLGRSTVVSNTIDDAGAFTGYGGRRYILEFDWEGCRPMGTNGEVVCPPDGPYPPQCNGGSPLPVRGSRGAQLRPRVWSLQPGVDKADAVHVFSETLMRPLKYTFVTDEELEGDPNEFVWVRRYELEAEGLREARIDFNCEGVYRTMAQAGIVNRGSDCRMLHGTFDLSAVRNRVPYEWALPHYYLVEANDSTQHPRSQLIGLVTPTGPRYRNMIVVEPESGKIVQSMIKEQISVRLFRHERNYFFTTHQAVSIPLYWTFETKNATQWQRSLLAYYQSEFRGLNAGFIACMLLGALSLIAALFFGMLLYRENSLQTVEEKRKKIQAELASALPPGEEEKEEEERGEGEFM